MSSRCFLPAKKNDLLRRVCGRNLRFRLKYATFKALSIFISGNYPHKSADFIPPNFVKFILAFANHFKKRLELHRFYFEKACGKTPVFRNTIESGAPLRAFPIVCRDCGTLVKSRFSWLGRAYTKISNFILRKTIKFGNKLHLFIHFNVFAYHYPTQQTG